MALANYSLTAAAERAIQSAWRYAPDESTPGPRELLLALWDEPECRAVGMLAERGVDAALVRHHWGVRERAEEERAKDEHSEANRPLSRGIRRVLSHAIDRLIDLDDPLSIGTEHLLLGLAAGDEQVGEWLRDRGVVVEEIETEIHRIHGFSREPIEFPEEPMGHPLPWPLETATSSVEAAPIGRPASESAPAWAMRILDASANRAREGLRVLEDYARFALDDPHLTRCLKELRHELAAAIALFDPLLLMAARDTRHDVGTAVATPSEYERPTPSDLLAANAKRLEESLRSLEEYGKHVDPAAGPRFERLRYQAYTLERALATTGRSIARLANARLYVLIDGCGSAECLRQRASDLIRAGVDVLQWRDKSLDDRTSLDRARLLRGLTAGTGTLFIVNDRPDIAALSQADGVHVGQEELSVHDARAIVGPQALIGVSTHSIEQARQAVLDGADYIGAGPTFPSVTKKFSHFAGLEYLRAAAAEIRLPTFAIGGISEANIDQVFAVGITRIAVSSAITKSADAIATAKRLKSSLLKNAGL